MWQAAIAGNGLYVNQSSAISMAINDSPMTAVAVMWRQLAKWQLMAVSMCESNI